MSNKRILCYMDFMCPTGFGTVAHNVLDRLTPWFRRVGVKVDVAALNYHDKTTEEYNDCITVINPRLFARNMDDNYYRDGVLKMLQIEDYDLLWAMNDVPVCGAMSPILGQLRTQKKFHNKPDFKMLLYTPIDSVPFQRYFKDLDIWDELVTYTKYGKKEAEYAFEKVNKRKVKFGVIAHGVDKVNFKKLNKKQELRDKFSLPQDTFIFGHVNKNQPRKDVGTTLIAFKKLKDMFASKGYQQPLALYLHLYHSDKSGIKIHIACERLGLVVGKDVLLPLEEKYVNNQYQPKEINEVYNCFDAFVTTTMAEGWGLTITEAMSVKLPIICPLHTSINEITDNGKIVYAIDDLWEHFQIEDAENVRFKSNPNQVAEKMLQVYEDVNSGIFRPNYDEKMNEYEWDKIADQWKIIIKRMLSI
jgi:glycosyltransferase involved in cell wall biosynthesis